MAATSDAELDIMLQFELGANSSVVPRLYHMGKKDLATKRFCSLVRLADGKSTMSTNHDLPARREVKCAGRWPINFSSFGLVYPKL